MPKEASSTQVNDARPETPPLSRRERVRETTLAEIKTVARRNLVTQGASGVSLRAIAREMGMTAPGLYRYFSSLDDLLLSLRADFFAELSAHVASANGTEEASGEDVDGHILVSLRAFRAWALANRAEFTLMFGPAGNSGPYPPDSPHGIAALEEKRRFAATFYALFDTLLQERRVPLPDTDSLSPELRRQLRAFADASGYTSTNATESAMRVLTTCWVRLYGLVCIEVFQHMAFVIDDMESLFEAELRDMLESIGVRYRPPSSGNPI